MQLCSSTPEVTKRVRGNQTLLLDNTHRVPLLLLAQLNISRWILALTANDEVPPRASSPLRVMTDGLLPSGLW